MKQYHYEVVYYGPEDEDLSEVWWDTDEKKIVSSNPIYINQMKRMNVNGRTFEDGEDFMKYFPYAFKTGYIACKRLDAKQV